jgi:Flp pilus assembly protein TadG
VLPDLKYLKQTFQRFCSDESGNLVEFVFVIPILLLIIFTILELGIMLAIKVNIQNCTQAGAYYGATGSYATGSSRTASAQAIMTGGLAGFLNTANVTITIQSFPTFSIASLGAAGVAGTGNPAQISMYKIQYSYSPACPMVAVIFGTTKVLYSTTYTKNELTFPA